MAVRRLFDLYPLQQTERPLKKALVYARGESEEQYSTQDCLREIDRVSAGLLGLGLSRGDRVAILAYAGSPRWLFLDFGMQQLGVVSLALHTSATADQLVALLNEAKARCCLVDDRELYEKVASIRHKVLSLKHLFTIGDLPDLPGWSDLVREPHERQLEAFHSTRAAVHEDDPALIAYTTGLGGRSRGVLLTHKNLVTNLQALATRLGPAAEKRYLSLAPASLIYERLSLYAAIAMGATVHFARPAEGLLATLSRVKPHLTTLLPRMVEKLYDYLLGESLKSGKLRRDLWGWASRLGQEAASGRRPPLSFWIKHQMAQALVYPRWHRRLGGQLEAMVVSGDRLRPELGRLLSAAGITVWQTYGLTEAAGLAALDCFDRSGEPQASSLALLPGLQGRLQAVDEQQRGTLLLQGPNVMMAYVDDSPGKIPGDWLVTGDMVALHEGRLRIFGPVHSQFQTAGGEIVFPAVLEGRIKRSPFVDQCMVVGKGEPRVGALIIPRFSLLERWCSENGIEWKAPPFMVAHPEVVALFAAELSAVTSDPGVERFTLLHQSWTLESGECTISLKLRRDVIQRRYAERIREMFAGEAR